MGQVTIAVGGRHYSLVCGDGEEPQLKSLADYVDRKAEQLTASLGQLSEARLLLMASLLIADELMELKSQMGHPTPSELGNAENTVNRIAERLENLAFSLEPQAQTS